MSAKKQYFPYRGNIKSVVADQSTICIVTTHPEGQSTGLYRIELGSFSFDEQKLSTGGTHLLQVEKDLYLVGEDKQLYTTKIKKGSPKPFGKPFSSLPKGLVSVSDKRLAVLYEDKVVVLDEKGIEVQLITLTETGSAIAANPTGTWMVVGTVQGNICTFECEEQSEFKASSSKQIHDGAVTQLLFEHNELRFLSSGNDLKLNLTHARGELEPENRGGKNGHDQALTAMIQGKERFYTGGDDKAIKAWPSGLTKQRPITVHKVGNVVGLAVAKYLEKDHLIVANDSNKIALFPLTEDEKIEPDEVLQVYGANSWLKGELEQTDVVRREQALKKAFEYNDSDAIKIIHNQAKHDRDYKVSLLATDLLGKIDNTRAIPPLEDLLKKNVEGVQVAAFEGLRKHLGLTSLEPAKKALATNSKMVGVLAIKLLTVLSEKDDQALTRLVQALNGKPFEVRKAALAGVESIYKDTPEADLIGLKSSHADIRNLALVSFFKRGFLNEEQVLQVLRKHLEDDDLGVKLLTFHISLLTQPRLSSVLRYLDENIHRTFCEIEGSLDKKAKELPKAKKAEISSLQAEDYRPLLEAMATRSLDVCLLGSSSLAKLKDQRAFGSLLQLSQEKQDEVRVQTCKALQDLNDRQGLKRLQIMLYDNAAPVRDAAFTAISSIESEKPLVAAEIGLNTEDENVRTRGLRILVETLKDKKIKKAEKEEAIELLSQTLNNSFPAVRSEAFKATLNLNLFGNSGTLEFILQSVHTDIRREVFVESIANEKEEWSYPILLQLIHDSDYNLSKDAFDFVFKTYKNNRLETVNTALTSERTHARKEVARRLIKETKKEYRQLLQKSLNDKEASIRNLVLDALIQHSAKDELAWAMASEYSEIALKAASARAMYGDSIALKPLLRAITTKEPEEKEAKANWKRDLLIGIEGLVNLADPQSFSAINDLIDHSDKNIRDYSALALLWISGDSNISELEKRLYHSNKQVQYCSALALSCLGDEKGISVFSGLQSGKYTADSLLFASMVKTHEDYLLSFLDRAADDNLQKQAFIIIMLLEMIERPETPNRLLAGLSSRHPKIRLMIAKALECYGKGELLPLIVEYINAQEYLDDWKISEKKIQTLAEVITFGSRSIKTFAITKLFSALTAERQNTFNHQWKIFNALHDKELKEIKKKAKAYEAPSESSSVEEINQVIFGSYVGLSRLVGDSGDKYIRETALRRLFKMAQNDANVADSVISVSMLALHDRSEEIREQVFKQLQELDVEVQSLAGEAFATGHRDIGALGLQLLADNKSKETTKLLEHVFNAYTNGLENDAAEVLIGLSNEADVYEKGLDVKSGELRNKSIFELSKLYKTEKTAVKALQNALDSKYQEVRHKSTLELAIHKDSKAFPALIKMLGDSVSSVQEKAIDSLLGLGDPKTPDALLDRIDNDRSGTAKVKALFDAVGQFRLTTVSARLFKFLTQTKHSGHAFYALETISGYDQKIHKNKPEELWLDKQYPRSDKILAKLLQEVYQLGDEKLLSRLIPSAKWSKNSKVEAALIPLARFPKDGVRRKAVEALGWRLLHRDLNKKVMVETLSHPDGDTKFLAAEALATVGYSEGINILLTSVDLLEDEDLQTRAIQALGKLADERALTLLLRIVNDEEHELQTTAIEAIGHMKHTPQAEKIFGILKGFTKGGDDSLFMAGVKGLRWFNSREGWKIIRDNADNSDWEIRQEIAKTLQFHNDPIAKEALIKMFKAEDDYDVIYALTRSLRRVYGADSLEPNYLFIQSTGHNYVAEVEKDYLTRIREHGDPSRVLGLLSKIPDDEIVEALSSGLLSKTPAPVEAAAEQITSNNLPVIEVAAQILGRGKDIVTESQKQILVDALGTQWNAWLAELAKHRPESDESHKLQTLNQCCSKILWACGQNQVPVSSLLVMLENDHHFSQEIRKSAIMTLNNYETASEAIPVLEKLALGADAKIRSLSSAVLKKLAPEKAKALTEKLLNDRVSFNWLVGEERDQATMQILRSGVNQLQYQGVALPHLIAEKDIEGLQPVLFDTSLPETTRLGVIEGLGKIATNESLEVLVEFATQEKEDDLKKAAWKTIRRAKRLMKKQQATQA